MPKKLVLFQESFLKCYQALEIIKNSDKTLKLLQSYLYFFTVNKIISS